MMDWTLATVMRRRDTALWRVNFFENDHLEDVEGDGRMTLR
jgi:hypothetical protein